MTQAAEQNWPVVGGEYQCNSDGNIFLRVDAIRKDGLWPDNRRFDLIEYRHIVRGEVVGGGSMFRSTMGKRYDILDHAKAGAR